MGRSSKVNTVKTEGNFRSPEHDKVETFKIVLLHNLKDTYYPGQFIEGHVVLNLKQGILTRGVTLHFCGTVSLKWKMRVPGKGAKCVDTEHFDATEEYFNVTNYLHEPGFIKPDRYEFPFRFFLSPPLPETYSDNICTIEYFLEARIKQDTVTLHDFTDRRDILVLSPLDLNDVIIPDVTLPAYAQRMKKLSRLCWNQGEIVAFLRLERGGFSPGETIHVQVDLINDSSRSISSTSVCLVEERVYYSASGHPLEHREDITAARKGSVEPRTSVEWRDIDLHVPKGQLFNVSASKIFIIRHFIQMTVKIARTWRNIVITLEVKLGAIPLKKKTIEQQPHERLQNPTRQPTKQTGRQTVAEIEAEKKRALKQAEKTRLPKDQTRQTRRVRNQITVQEETDPTDYLLHAEELERRREMQRTRTIETHY